MAEKSEEVKKESKKSNKLVKMECDGKQADVHPDMVDDYKSGGYVEVK